MDGTTAFDLARRKARHGHRDWIVWRDRTGDYHAECRTPATIKHALLANGTKGRAWWIISASTGVSLIGFWAMGLIMLRNARHGC